MYIATNLGQCTEIGSKPTNANWEAGSAWTRFVGQFFIRFYQTEYQIKYIPGTYSFVLKYYLHDHPICVVDAE